MGLLGTMFELFKSNANLDDFTASRYFEYDRVYYYQAERDFKENRGNFSGWTRPDPEGFKNSCDLPKHLVFKGKPYHFSTYFCPLGADEYPDDLLVGIYVDSKQDFENPFVRDLGHLNFSSMNDSVLSIEDAIAQESKVLKGEESTFHDVVGYSLCYAFSHLTGGGSEDIIFDKEGNVMMYSHHGVDADASVFGRFNEKGNLTIDDLAASVLWFCEEYADVLLSRDSARSNILGMHCSNCDTVKVYSVPDVASECPNCEELYHALAFQKARIKIIEA